MCRRNIIFLFALLAGTWWLLPGRACSQEERNNAIGVTLSSEGTNLFRQTGETSSTSIGGFRRNLELRYGSGGTLWNLAAEQRSFTIDHSETAGNAAIHAGEAARSLSLAFRHTLSLLRIEGDVHTTSRSGSTTFGAGGTLTYLPSHTPLKELWCRIENAQAAGDFSAAYMGAQMSLLPEATGVTIGIGGRAVLWPGGILGAEQRNYFGSPEDQRRDYSNTNRGHLSQHGFLFEQTTAAGDAGGSAGYSGMAFDNAMALEYQGLSFAHLTVPKAYAENAWVEFWKADEAGRTFSARVAWFGIAGKLAGSIETWPFVSVAVSALENRYYYRAFGSIQAWEASVDKRWNAWGVALSTGLEGYRLQPDVHLETWQPEFLVFGFKNYTDTRPDIASAYLAGIHLGCSFGFSSCDLAIEARQLLPVSVQHLDRNREEGATGSEPAPEVRLNTTDLKTDGGRWFRVGVGYHLR